jgi:hypothetical protein
MDVISLFFLLIFGASLIGGYVAIRRQVTTLANAGLISAVINVIALIVVGLARDADPALSIIGGIVVGLGLTGAMVTMAAFFQNNQAETLAAYDAASKEKSRQG